MKNKISNRDSRGRFTATKPEIKEKIMEVERCSHYFNSVAAGFDHQNGFSNYSICEWCGLTTRSYSHSDFSAREEAEREAEGNYSKVNHNAYRDYRYYPESDAN